MQINRRRAPSSQISREKKLEGHKREDAFASLIDACVLSGTQKADVEDKNRFNYSVKGGKKWQVFLYGYNRIAASQYLCVLQHCLDAFTEDYSQYLKDRETCISYKEHYVSTYGKPATKRLSNEDIIKELGVNTYTEAKEQLAEATKVVCLALKDNSFRRNFICEAMFNNEEVDFLAIKAPGSDVFSVYDKEEVLDILSENLFPELSRAGRIAEDYNVPGQKTLLKYTNPRGRTKNIVEIEIRNDSNVHYRQVRFNMYSADTLYLLSELKSQKLCQGVMVYGKAIGKIVI